MFTKKLVVGNWKMHPPTLKEAKTLIGTIKRFATKLKKSQVVICPPHVYLSSFIPKTRSYKKFMLGSQDVFWSNTGPHTGEIAPHMLKDLGVQYVIVGHSERRKLGETNEIIAQKVQAVRKEKLTPIVCVGEQSRDSSGSYLRFLDEQIRRSLAGISRADAKNVIIAYEPLWAIGKSAKDAITTHALHQTLLFIKKILVKQYGKTTAEAMRLLYGGSVESANVGNLQQVPEVGGYLIGHASLEADEFKEILTIVEQS